MNTSVAEYNYTWQKARVKHLELEPLCRTHALRGAIVEATVVDHIKPHRGDVSLFWDPTNWQSLCAECHSADKQHIEIHGFSKTIGVDGWPIDSSHPVNHARRNTIGLKLSDNEGRTGGGVGQKSTA